MQRDSFINPTQKIILFNIIIIYKMSKAAIKLIIIVIKFTKI